MTRRPCWWELTLAALAVVLSVVALALSATVVAAAAEDPPPPLVVDCAATTEAEALAAGVPYECGDHDPADVPALVEVGDPVVVAPPAAPAPAAPRFTG